jgi:hypothetical protein
MSVLVWARSGLGMDVQQAAVAEHCGFCDSQKFFQSSRVCLYRSGKSDRKSAQDADGVVLATLFDRACSIC